MKKVISRLGQGNLGQVQVAALFALGFFGFLYWDDRTRLSFQTILQLYFLPIGKMSSSVIVLGIFFCPVSVIERFIRWEKDSNSSFFFC